MPGATSSSGPAGRPGLPAVRSRSGLRLTAGWLAALVLLPLARPAPGSQARTAGPELPAQAARAARPVSVFCLRHAEKAADGGRDPGLSQAGEARARALARLLGQAGVTHLFATEYQRTQRTLAELARCTGLEVEVRGARDPEALVRELRALPPGSVAVVAGHSNTVPDLVRRLGGEVAGTREGMLAEDEYDRLFLQTLGDAQRPGACVELRYGAP